MNFPSANDWLFSVKTFAASMLALYIALAVPLPRPYWAMATVYIVANPFVGATRSKALYRALGTALGAAGSVLLVPPFVESPYLFSALVALWTGSLLYLSLSDRTARSYVFLSAGFTLPLISLPTVTNPTTIFNVAVARTEEITLGIVCISVIGSIVFPNKLGPTLIARTDAWFADAAQAMRDALQGRVESAVMLPRQQRLAAIVKQLDVLLSQLSYDHASPKVVERGYSLKERMQVFLPVLSALTDPLSAFRNSAGAALVPQFEPLIADVVKWVNAPPRGRQVAPESDPEATSLRARIAALRLAPPAGLSIWDSALLSNALWRVQQVIDIWQDCHALRALIDHPEGTWQPRYRYRHWLLAGDRFYVDHTFMFISALGAMAFIMVSSSLWIASGWHDGASAVSISAVAVCFFSGLDEPAPAIFRFFIATVISMIASGILLFVLLPHVQQFEMLVLTFAGPFILVGTLMVYPQFSQIAILVGLFTATFISLSGSYDANVLEFTNNNLAVMGGLVFAFVWTRVTRPFGVEIAAQRLLRLTWSDVARAAAPQPVDDERTFFSRMVDRLMQLLPRLATSGPHHHPSIETFRDLRVASNAFDLRHFRDSVTTDVSSVIDDVLANVRAYYELCIARRKRQPVPPAMVDAIDAAVERIAEHSRPAAGPDAAPSFSSEIRLRDALHALVGLRLSMAPPALRVPARLDMPGAR